MDNATCTDQTFNKIDFATGILGFTEFDACTFNKCKFPGVNLSGKVFMDCKFMECDLSTLKFGSVQLRNVSFTGCKLMGTDFSDCNDLLLSFAFEKCNLDYSSFHQKKIKRTVFKECSLKEVDFSFADLTGSVFYKCDLSRGIFQHSNLTGVDFRSADHYFFDLDSNIVKKARFSASGALKLLDKYGIIVE
jgi:fluoroquinolone resistance protein